ncbi:MAG TPA: DUF1440 domain-containing protein [Anaeromyxobacter sp.]
MAFGRKAREGVLAGALVGAASGVIASWVMEKAQGPIWKLGGEATRRRERDAQGDLEPATVRVAERAARAVGRPLPDARKGAAGEAVHYATGAALGALFGVLAPRTALPALVAGAVFGGAVWLLNDETLVPALGFSRKPWDYPASTHAKSLAAHLVYGAATGAGFRLIDAAVR